MSHDAIWTACGNGVATLKLYSHNLREGGIRCGCPDNKAVPKAAEEQSTELDHLFGITRPTISMVQPSDNEHCDLKDSLDGQDGYVPSLGSFAWAQPLCKQVGVSSKNDYSGGEDPE
jgi:hypothetical protein